MTGCIWMFRQYPPLHPGRGPTDPSQGGGPGPEQADVTVDLPDLGKLVGGKIGNIYRYWRGIPFAEPPVGPLRWAPPVPIAPWRPATRMALTEGPTCTQAWLPRRQSSRDGYYRKDQEDCLYLNVYAPVRGCTASLLPTVAGLLIGQLFAHSSRMLQVAAPPAGTLYPVLLYIHGGGYESGGGDQDPLHM